MYNDNRYLILGQHTVQKKKILHVKDNRLRPFSNADPGRMSFGNGRVENKR